MLPHGPLKWNVHLHHTVDAWARQYVRFGVSRGTDPTVSAVARKVEDEWQHVSSNLAVQSRRAETSVSGALSRASHRFELLLARVEGRNPQQLAPIGQRIARQYEQVSLREAHESAFENRGAWITPEDHGMATLSITTSGCVGRSCARSPAPRIQAQSLTRRTQPLSVYGRHRHCCTADGYHRLRLARQRVSRGHNHDAGDDACGACH